MFNWYTKKSLVSLALFIAAGIILFAMVITLTDCKEGGGISIWNTIDALASICAIVLGLHHYVPRK